MPGFNRSLTSKLDYQPWKYTTQPTYNPDGSILTPGVTTSLDGVFILLSPQLVTYLKNNLTLAQKTELQTWVNSYTEAQCALWHVPVWAGQSSAVYIRVPATDWNDPSTPPPQKVKDYFQDLFA